MWLTYLGLVVAGIVALFHLLRYYNNSKNGVWKRQRVPILNMGKAGVKWYDIILQRKTMIEIDQLIWAEAGDVPFFGYASMFESVFHVKDPELIKQITIKDFENFADRRAFAATNSDKVFGRMLTFTSGQEWKDLRSVMSPTFSTGKIKRMFELFNMAAKGLTDFLNKKHKVSNELDFSDAISRFTSAAISAIAFGQQVDVFEDESTFRKMAVQLTAPNFKGLIKFMLAFAFPWLAKVFDLSIMNAESSKYFSTILKRMLDERKAEGGAVKRDDFLQLLIEAQKGQLAKGDEAELNDYEKDAQLKKDLAGKKSAAAVLDDETLIAQAFLFFLGGTDTIESAVTLCVYMLARHPEIQQKLAEEVHRVMEEHDGVLSYDVLNEMEYLDMVVSESLRYHPPAFITERFPSRDYTVPGTSVVIPKKTRIVIPIRAIHFEPKYYDNPEQFNPENFTAANKQKRHPYAYLPFGLGPRNCIAMRFALIETKAAIAYIVNGFKLEPCASTPIPFRQSKASGVLKPENGMPLRFEPRIW